MSFNNDVMNYYIYAVNRMLCKVSVVHTQKPPAGVSGCVVCWGYMCCAEGHKDVFCMFLFVIFSFLVYELTLSIAL